jgi:hypothetical protein
MPEVFRKESGKQPLPDASHHRVDLFR